jgi:phage-related protein
MAKQTFPFPPDLGAKQTFKPNVNKTAFGDGYEQRVPVGINTNPCTWTCVFTNPLDDNEAILAFLTAMGAFQSFLWQDPKGVVATYVCRGWDSTKADLAVYTTNAVFEQVFEF